MLPRRAEWLTNLPQLSGEALVPRIEASLGEIVAEASPGDRLRYRLQLQNLADFALSGLTLRDEIDRLNADPAFQPGTLTRPAKQLSFDRDSAHGSKLASIGRAVELTPTCRAIPKRDPNRVEIASCALLDSFNRGALSLQ